MNGSTTPKLQCILETALYVDNMERSINFYKNVMQLEPILQTTRLCAFSVGGKSVLLIFQRGSTLLPFETTGGIIPSHNGNGPLHNLSFRFIYLKFSLLDWKDGKLSQ